ncbi:MAG: zinc metallopeptidase [Atopobium sp.]|nr:zinc metallopeptidase [Atopobium sp.]
MYVYGLDGAYFLVVFVCLALGWATQAYINKTYARWSLVDASSTGTGAQVARRMLDENGASAVGIARTSGHLSDFYDPRDNRLHLSDENYDGGSVASVAVACHEAGHAVQTAKGYLPGRIRTALVPVVNITQQVWGILFFMGFFFEMVGFLRLALVLFAFSVIFQFVTLPVEIDASRRAVAYLGHADMGLDQRGARKVLTAAALTYVAAALMSVIQLLYLFGRTERR